MEIGYNNMNLRRFPADFMRISVYGLETVINVFATE